MAEGPTGTVTFLFTDLVGSTAAWERDRRAMEQALERHDTILRKAITSAGGRIFAVTGDGFGAAYARAEQAIRSCADAQRTLAEELWPGGLDLQVRMGLHTGEAQERDGNYFGPALNRAARVMGIARGGEVLVTSATCNIVADRLDDDVGLVPMGDAVLRGLDDHVEVFLLRTGASEVPPLPLEVRARLGNLPSGLPRLVGRSEELTRLEAELASHRLVTVIGVGGVGKTSLALRAAAECGKPAWLVELAEVALRGDVVTAVCRSVGVSPGPGVSPLEALLEWARRSRLLLVVDNCEHVIAEVAEAAESLLAAAPGVTVLATSREPLYVRGEQVFALGPLEVDGSASAIELFCDRAREVNPSFDTEQNSGAIEELCRRLDGIPLAIELAAARMRSLRPADVIDHLEERFRLLTGGRRTTVERHQTLRAAVGWSYDLLDEDEQRVFECLAAFAGRFSLEDACAVADPVDEMDEIGVLDVLARLVDRCLVETADSELRFRMLETIRAFGRERLDRAGRADEVRRLHAIRCAALAQATRALVPGLQEMAAFRTTIQRVGDYRGATEWAAQSGQLDIAAGIVLDLSYCGGCWEWFEPVGWLSGVFDDPPDPLPSWWASMLAAQAEHVLNASGDLAGAEQVALSALRLDEAEPRALTVLTLIAVNQGRSEQALALARQMMDSARQRNQPTLELGGLIIAGFVATGADREHLLAEAERATTSLRTPRFAALATWARARSMETSDPSTARRLLEAALEMNPDYGDRGAIPIRRDRAIMDIDDNPTEAARSLLDTLHRAIDIGMLNQAWGIARRSTGLLVSQGHPEAAALIAGACGLEALTPSEAHQFANVDAALNDQLGARRQELEDQGRQLTLSELIDTATDALIAIAGTTAASPSSMPSPLGRSSP